MVIITFLTFLTSKSSRNTDKGSTRRISGEPRLKRREMMPKALGTAKVRVKSQITLSPEVIRLLKLELGDYVAFVRNVGFVILKKVE